MVERDALRRQLADVHRVEAGFVDEHRHFDAGAIGQVGDQLGVGYVAVERESLAALQGIDDIGCIFMLALQLDGRFRWRAIPGHPVCQVFSVFWYSCRM